jgi:hypothetical protein
MIMVLVLALGALEIFAARGVPDARVKGGATADILRAR